MSDTAQLEPIRFWRMAHGRVVKTLATTMGGEGCLWDSGDPRDSRFKIGIHLMK